MIICSNEEEEKSHFISKLHHFRRPFIPRIDLQEYRNFLAIHFTGQTQSTGTSASCVDFEQYVQYSIIAIHWMGLQDWTSGLTVTQIGNLAKHEFEQID